MEPLWFYKMGKHLIAADEEAEEAVRPVAQGEAIPVFFKRDRHPLHHKKYWALITMVAQNQEKYPNKNILHIQVKIAAGWYDVLVSAAGNPIYVPRSIAFGAMDQTEFEQYYREAIAAIVRLLPQFNAEWLEEHVVAFMNRGGR